MCNIWWLLVKNNSNSITIAVFHTQLGTTQFVCWDKTFLVTERENSQETGEKVLRQDKKY